MRHKNGGSDGAAFTSTCEAHASGSYSSIACVGGNCLLHNLCTNRQGLVFHAGPSSLDMPLLGRNTHENLDDLHMHPGGTTHTADRMLHVQKRPGCIDLSEFQNGWHPETVHVLIDRVFPNAPAHTLADEVVAVFRSLELWGQLDLLDAPRNGSSTNNNKLIMWMRGGTKLTRPRQQQGV